MIASSTTIQAAAEASTLSGDLPIRLIVPFALGAIFTLVITAVNHRRDHIKHVRDILSSSIQKISHQGALFWATEYDDEAMVKLRGSVVFLQHLLPYALDSTQVDKKTADKMQHIFADISHVALFSENDLNADSHSVDIERVAHLSVCCARAEALSNTMLLDCMSLRSIIVSNFIALWTKAKKIGRQVYNACFVA